MFGLFSKAKKNTEPHVIVWYKAPGGAWEQVGYCRFTSTADRVIAKAKKTFRGEYRKEVVK